MKTRQYNNGDTCSVSANPGSHYTFDGWFENDSIVSSDNPYSFTVSGDRTLEGKFTANSYTITTNVSPVSGGSISGGGTYDYGDTCTLTATPNQDYRFATWTDGNGNFLSNDNPFSFTVSGDLTVRGVFSTGYNTYTITVISPHGSVSGDGVYALDDTCTLTSTPNPGYSFDHWEMNGVEISDNNPYSFTVDGDKTITAVYEVSPASLKITTNGTSSVYLQNANNQSYTWHLSAGLNEYYGTEPGFALNEITNLNPSNVLSYIISMDASELTSWTNINNFSGCPYLESVILPDSITSMVMLAFSPCPNLESINFPSSLTTIGNAAFKDCTSLESVDLSDTLLTEARFNVFNGCTSLISIILPDTLTSIGQQAFYGCTGLTSINLPNTLTSIGNNAFADCTSLTNLTLPSSLTTIGNSAFDGCTSLTLSPDGDLPTSLTTIGNFAFAYCTSLDGISIVMTNTRSIGEGAFSNCTGLTGVYLDNNKLQTIGISAFYNCSSIEDSIVLPSTLTSIGDYAFKFADIPGFYCYATTPPTIGTETFNTLTLCPIYVPAASLSAYQSSWSEYASRIYAL